MLTEKIIRDAKPTGKAFTVWDDRLKGLGMQVTQGGKKNYVLRYKAGDRWRQAIIARCAEMPLQAAREKAAIELVRIRDAEPDPLERRREALEAPTVNDGLARYFDEYAPARVAAGRLSPTTVTEYRKSAKARVRPAIGDRRIRDVTKRDIEKMVAGLGPAARNRLLAFASMLFNRFEDWEWRDQRTNPVRGVEKAREEPRDRTLTASELTALNAALESQKERWPAAVGAIRFAALTGLRIGEACAARWQDFNAEGGVLVLPSSKTGRRTQPLSSPALELLERQPRINDYIFTNGRAAVAYKHVRRIFALAATEAGLDDVRLHDLRRTVMTDAARRGVGAFVLRDLLGHRSLEMANRYIRRTGGALVDATEESGIAMAAMLNGEQGGEVVSLRERNRG